TVSVRLRPVTSAGTGMLTSRAWPSSDGTGRATGAPMISAHRPRTVSTYERSWGSILDPSRVRAGVGGKTSPPGNVFCSSATLADSALSGNESGAFLLSLFAPIDMIAPVSARATTMTIHDETRPVLNRPNRFVDT